MRDFGSATEAMRIIDLFALQVFANNLDRGNFRVLQHNPGEYRKSPWPGRTDANDRAPRGRELPVREGFTRIIVDWSGSWQAAR